MARENGSTAVIRNGPRRIALEGFFAKDSSARKFNYLLSIQIKQIAVKFDLDHSTVDARPNGGRRQHVYLTLAPSALRANAKSMSEMSGGMMGASQAAMLPEKLALREKMMTAHLEALRKFKAAVEPLYAALMMRMMMVRTGFRRYGPERAV